MSLAENLLNSLDETAYQNMRIAGGVPEEHIKVGQDRVITVPNALKTIAVKGDKDVETATIDCVRYWDGHDLSTFAIYLNYILPSGDEGTYIPQSITKSEDTFSFDWLIGSEFTYAQGKMTFWIVAKLTDNSGTLVRQWSSFQNSDCTIAQGGDKIYVPEKQTDQDVISQAISISRSSAEIAEQQANLAQQAAGKAASDARDAAEAEVSRIIGELGVVQELGDSPNSVVSQLKVTEEFNKTNAKVNRNSKRITNIEQGLTPDSFETDDSVAYQKDVPANALPYAAVQKVGGMTYKSKNLFDIETAPIDKGNVIIGDNTLQVITDLTICEISKDKLTIGKTYKLSGIGGAIAIEVKNANGDIISSQYGVTLDSNNSVTITEETNVLWIYFYKEAGLYRNIMLNEGSTAQPYEPYFEGLRSAKVTEVKSVGVNLFSPTISALNRNGVTFSVGGDRTSIILNGTAAISDWVDVGTIKLGNHDYCIHGGKAECGVYIAGSAKVNHGGNTLVPEEDKNKELTWGLKTIAGTTYSNFVIYPMLNKGSTDQPYTPYVEHTFPIPEAVQALDGYGLGITNIYEQRYYNNIDWEKKQFVKRVTCVDMGTLNWEMGGAFYAYLSDKKANLCNYLCAKYDDAAEDFTRMPDKTITGNYANGYIYVKDTAYTDAATFKAAMSGVMLVYELAEPIVTDISDLITADNLIGVEGGGTLTFENEYGYAVPSEVEYQVEV